MKKVYLEYLVSTCIYLKDEEEFKQYLEEYKSRCTYALTYPCWIVHRSYGFFTQFPEYKPLEKELKEQLNQLSELARDIEIMKSLKEICKNE